VFNKDSVRAIHRNFLEKRRRKVEGDEGRFSGENAHYLQCSRERRPPRDVIKGTLAGAGKVERVDHPQKPLALCDKLIKHL
jgi:hypothetical protein